MVSLTKLWDSAYGQMRVAGFMSGGGSNLKEIIEHELELKTVGYSPYHLAVIFSNRADSKAPEIGREYDIPVVIRDDRGFSRARGKKLKEIREEFDSETLRALEPYECGVAALGGYMLYASHVIFNNFLSINVHPADLSILDERGERKYTGDKAVQLALKAGAPVLRSTTHILDELPDHGPILMVSAPVKVRYPIDDDIMDRMAKVYQDRLKEIGDWVIFPRTLEAIAKGRFEEDEQGKIYYDGNPVPNGVRVEA